MQCHKHVENTRVFEGIEEMKWGMEFFKVLEFVKEVCGNR